MRSFALPTRCLPWRRADDYEFVPQYISAVMEDDSGSYEWSILKDKWLW